MNQRPTQLSASFSCQINSLRYYYSNEVKKITTSQLYYLVVNLDSMKNKIPQFAIHRIVKEIAKRLETKESYNASFLDISQTSSN